MNRCDRCVMCATSLWLFPRTICRKVASPGLWIGNHSYVSLITMVTYVIGPSKHESCFGRRVRKAPPRPLQSAAYLTETANRS